MNAAEASENIPLVSQIIAWVVVGGVLAVILYVLWMVVKILAVPVLWVFRLVARVDRWASRNWRRNLPPARTGPRVKRRVVVPVPAVKEPGEEDRTADSRRVEPDARRGGAGRAAARRLAVPVVRHRTQFRELVHRSHHPHFERRDERDAQSPGALPT